MKEFLGESEEATSESELVEFFRLLMNGRAGIERERVALVGYVPKCVFKDERLSVGGIYVLHSSVNCLRDVDLYFLRLPDSATLMACVFLGTMRYMLSFGTYW